MGMGPDRQIFIFENTITESVEIFSSSRGISGLGLSPHFDMEVFQWQLIALSLAQIPSQLSC